MEKISSLRSPEHLRRISTDGVLLSLNDPTLGETETHDLVYPYFILSLCLSGSAHSLYDMKEISPQKNDLLLILPGHITRPLGYEPRYFSKLFRAYSNGISPHEWIQNYISTRAKRMMSEHPEQTVKEITFELGFPNTANFCRYFKKATGLTPQEYKQKNRP